MCEQTMAPISLERRLVLRPGPERGGRRGSGVAAGKDGSGGGVSRPLDQIWEDVLDRRRETITLTFATHQKPSLNKFAQQLFRFRRAQLP